MRYKLSLRDVAEMFLKRGFVLTHEAIRDWESRFAPLIAEQLHFFQKALAISMINGEPMVGNTVGFVVEDKY